MKKLIFILMVCSLFAEKVESVEEINIKVSASETIMQNVPYRIYSRTKYSLGFTDRYKKRELYSGLIF